MKNRMFGVQWLIWNASTEGWEAFEWDQYDKKWWFEVVPGSHANIMYAHTKHVAGKQFHVHTHPATPGRYLGCYYELTSQAG